jgi:hypothetical protein
MELARGLGGDDPPAVPVVAAAVEHGDAALTIVADTGRCGVFAANLGNAPALGRDDAREEFFVVDGLGLGSGDAEHFVAQLLAALPLHPHRKERGGGERFFFGQLGQLGERPDCGGLRVIQADIEFHDTSKQESRTYRRGQNWRRESPPAFDAALSVCLAILRF